MSHTLTQPEELDHALMEMAGSDTSSDATGGNKADACQELSRCEPLVLYP